MLPVAYSGILIGAGRDEYLNMAKAQITLKDGTVVKIDGTPEEIAAAAERLSHKPKGRRAPRPKAQRVKLVDLVSTLVDGGFFKTPRDLASVKAGLEEMGHHYPVTTLSGVMLGQVRRRNLKRLKQNKRWVYTR